MGNHPSHHLPQPEVERLRAKYGDKVDAVLAEAAQIFGGLDVSTDGVLNRSEFSKSIGIMGTGNAVLSNFIFDAIDTDRNNELSYAEFVDFLLTVTLGSVTDKLHFGFRLMDLDKNGVITKSEQEEIVTMISTFIQVLTSFQLVPPKKDSYVEDLWKMWDFNSDGTISLEEYCRGCLANQEFIAFLGGHQKSEQAATRIGRRVLLGQHKWDFMLSVMIGIQMAIEAIPVTAQPVLEPADFERKQSILLPTAQRRVLFKVYAPTVFREIRRSFGVDDESFKSSLGIKQVLGRLLMGDLTGLSELVSEGKSGSFFYFSGDNKYLVKTISASERRTLRRILRDYVAHFQSNRHSLLSRIYGLYKLKLDDTTSTFVIMGNVFNPAIPVHQRFDLKGSTQGRTVGEAHLNEPSVVYKDLDLIKLGRKINVGIDLKAPLMAQIKSDSDFLTAHGIIDYSFLLGVHKSDKPPQVYTFENRPETPLTPLTPNSQTSPSTPQSPSVGTDATDDVRPATGDSNSETINSVVGNGGTNTAPLFKSASSGHVNLRPAPSAGSSSAEAERGAAHHSRRSSQSASPPGRPPPISTSVSHGSSRFASLRRSSKTLARLFSFRRADGQSVRTRFSDLDDSQLPTGQTMFQLAQGGCLSERMSEADRTVVVGEEILYVGIIDILIPYEAFKQGEHLLKSIISDGKQISVVPPDEYGPRFQKFVCSHIC